MNYYDFVPDLILSVDWWELKDSERRKHIIFEIDNAYYILIDESKKIDDVSKMPYNLQEEYIKYKKEKLEDRHVNTILNKLYWWVGSNNDETSSQSISSEKYQEYTKHINILKKLKLDLKIKKIIERN